MTNTPPTTEQHPSKEEADAYDRWLREQIQESIENLHPLTPHEEVMAELRKALEKKRDANVSGPLES